MSWQIGLASAICAGHPDDGSNKPGEPALVQRYGSSSWKRKEETEVQTTLGAWPAVRESAWSNGQRVVGGTMQENESCANSHQNRAVTRRPNAFTPVALALSFWLSTLAPSPGGIRSCALISRRLSTERRSGAFYCQKPGSSDKKAGKCKAMYPRCNTRGDEKKGNNCR